MLRAGNRDKGKQSVFVVLWPWASHLTSLSSFLCITNMDRITYLTKVLWGLKGCCQMLLIQILSVWMVVFNRIILTPVIRETLPWFLPFFTLGNIVLSTNVKFSALCFAKYWSFGQCMRIWLGIWQMARDCWGISVCNYASVPFFIAYGNLELSQWHRLGAMDGRTAGPERGRQ